jgi:hypothetical protein
MIFHPVFRLAFRSECRIALSLHFNKQHLRLVPDVSQPAEFMVLQVVQWLAACSLRSGDPHDHVLE